VPHGAPDLFWKQEGQALIGLSGDPYPIVEVVRKRTATIAVAIDRKPRPEKQTAKKESRAQLASPQPRPTSPVNGAGGMTGCYDYAQALRSFLLPGTFFRTRLSDQPSLEPAWLWPRYLSDRHVAGGCVIMALLSSGISKGILGVALLSLGFGAVASGRDLGGDGILALNTTQTEPAIGSAGTINRAAKTDRAVRIGGAQIPTRTVSLRLNDLANTSVLIRIPVVHETTSGSSTSMFVKPGQGKPTVACEPVVSVLTEVAKSLQPGRCVT
jgi:hypothetical protein